jgi:NAD(P)-dependent dehydrogenase (short-subunit alcohol dehydrogenase family)
MARIFITGSSTGLGLMAGQLLIEQGHQVVLHGRNRTRADQAMADAPGAQGAVVGDLSQISDTKSVAEQVNQLGRFDAVIHNAGVGYREGRPVETEQGIPHVFATNVLAPYILTALIERPDRLIYLSSGMHHDAAPNFDDLLWTKRPWQGAQAYAESKLYDVILAFARQPLAGRACQCARARLGRNPHGRFRRTRRPEQSACHAGVACGQ